jgi:hypothetical protein
MTDEDWEFNRIEMEARVRQMAVRYAIEKANKIDRELGIPFVTAEELEELLKKD